MSPWSQSTIAMARWPRGGLKASTRQRNRSGQLIAALRTRGSKSGYALLTRSRPNSRRSRAWTSELVTLTAGVARPDQLTQPLPTKTKARTCHCSRLFYEAHPQGRHTGNSKRSSASALRRPERRVRLASCPAACPLIARFRFAFRCGVREIESDAFNCRHGRGAATFAADA